MLNILVPLAGAGKSFKDKEFTFPKALVEIHGKPMIQIVLESLRFTTEHQFIFIIRKEEDLQYNLGSVLSLLTENPKIIYVESPTKGAACSALLAIDHIDSENPLIIVNADQYIDSDVNVIYQNFSDRGLDGGIVTFESVHPRWSFVRLDGDGMVTEAAEKRPLSRHATAGFYYFRQGKMFVRAGVEMIKKEASVNDQYYVCPAYNEMILLGKKIGTVNIEKNRFYPLGSPEDVQEFETCYRNFGL